MSLLFATYVAAVAVVGRATDVALASITDSGRILRIKRAMPSHRQKIVTKEKGAKSLYVRMFPADLLRRLNGVAEFIGMERDVFVTELLKQDMRRFETSQAESSEWWKTRIVIDSQKR